MASLIVILNEGSLKQTLLTIEAGTSGEELAEARGSPEPQLHGI